MSNINKTINVIAHSNSNYDNEMTTSCSNIGNYDDLVKRFNRCGYDGTKSNIPKYCTETEPLFNDNKIGGYDNYDDIANYLTCRIAKCSNFNKVTVGETIYDKWYQYFFNNGPWMKTIYILGILCALPILGRILIGNLGSNKGRALFNNTPKMNKKTWYIISFIMTFIFAIIIGLFLNLPINKSDITPANPFITSIILFSISLVLGIIGGFTSTINNNPNPVDNTTPVVIL